MSEDHILEFIGKEYPENATEHELKELKSLVEQNEGNIIPNERLHELWISGKREVYAKGANEVYKDIVSQKSLGVNLNQDNYSKTRFISRNGLLRAAVLFGLFTVAGLFVFRYVNQHTNIETLATGLISKSNPQGEKSTVVLPNGTMVKLNTEYYLASSNIFNEDKREVKLIAEAFFDVTRNSKKPFLVRSGGV